MMSASRGSGKRSNHSRSRLFMGIIYWYQINFVLEPHEKAVLEEQEKEEFRRRLDEFKTKEGVTSEDVKEFEKQEILKKSLNDVK